MQLVRWSMRIPRASDARCKVDLVAQIALGATGCDEIRDSITARGCHAARLFKD